MDLSRVPLPTFILEPRSLLEKFTDFMIHCDLLHGVAKMENPVDRIMHITKWYLSGFSYKPKGVKKPYNPILGEIFRSRWSYHGTTAHLIAEQISHHPPVSVVYISNRKDGYVMTGIINPRSKFTGNSLCVLVEGSITLHMLERNEQYTFNFPNIYARGILFGTLLTEVAGQTTLVCKQTNLKVDMDFKTKNSKDVLYSIGGKWDRKVDITNAKTKKTEVFWECNTTKKTPRFIRPMAQQEPNESQRLWTHVAQGIIKKDQKEATKEKIKLENDQRQADRERKERGVDWEPKYFKKEGDQWIYKYANMAPYDPNEPPEIEVDGIIQFENVEKTGDVGDAAAVEQQC
ncbi:hypothetical protein SAMD00019534_016290, partial [Acytostelium subglobosum LB1]|uniref:hypothetical protein n=1 Tax=Acytostelium subglobosum LB1 TaxID=1410327 RepID=UPI00064517AB